MDDDNNVMVCISKLRAKLSNDGSKYIKTVRGLGYRLRNRWRKREWHKNRYVADIEHLETFPDYSSIVASNGIYLCL